MSRVDFNRRDFLKLASLFPLGAMPPGLLRNEYLDQQVDQQQSTSNNDEEILEKLPRLEIEYLPKWVSEILSITPRMSLNEIGRLESRDGSGTQVLLDKSYVCELNTNLVRGGDKRYLFKTDPRGLVLHYAGNGVDWNHNWAKHGTARELARVLALDNEKGDSAAFVVGDEPYRVDAGWDDPLSIVQTEVPYEGKWVWSSHSLYPNHEAGGKKGNMFLEVTNQLTQEFTLSQAEERLDPGWEYKNATILQTMSKKAREAVNIPNRETLGIEVLGIDFHQEENYPRLQKIANTLAVMTALGEKYSIPGFNMLGHYELDDERGDPGKEFLYQMRLIYGLYPLLKHSPKIARATFEPFIEARHSADPIADYFSFITKMFKMTTNRRRYEDLYSKLGIGEIFEEVFRANWSGIRR